MNNNRGKIEEHERVYFFDKGRINVREERIISISELSREKVWKRNDSSGSSIFASLDF